MFKNINFLVWYYKKSKFEGLYKIKKSQLVLKTSTLSNGLTTKPRFVLQERIENNTTIFEIFWTKKVSISKNYFQILRSGRDSNPSRLFGRDDKATL